MEFIVYEGSYQNSHNPSGTWAWSGSFTLSEELILSELKCNFGAVTDFKCDVPGVATFVIDGYNYAIRLSRASSATDSSGNESKSAEKWTLNGTYQFPGDSTRCGIMEAICSRDPLHTPFDWNDSSNKDIVDLRLGILRILSFNIWVSFKTFPDGIDCLLNIIRSYRPHVVHLQEVNKADLETIAQRLGGGWKSVWATGMLTRLPCDTIYTSGGNSVYGVKVQVSPESNSCQAGYIRFYNSHLTAYPYAPYVWRDTGDIQKTIEQAQRVQGKEIQAHLAANLREDSHLPAILTGDHNIPSHLDFPGRDGTDVNSSTDLIDRNLKCPYPVSKHLEGAKWVDAFRQTHPNPFTHPGHTWTPLPNPAANEVHDRIDYIYFKQPDNDTKDNGIQSIKVKSCCIIDSRPCEPHRQWPSDHRALLATFHLDVKGLTEGANGDGDEKKDLRNEFIHTAGARHRPWYCTLITDSPGAGRCDITPLFMDSLAMQHLIADLSQSFQLSEYDSVAGIDALGFILASAIAQRTGKGMIAIRKAGKLPVPAARSEDYKDYSGTTKALEIAPIKAETRVLLVDEWVETGATAMAACSLLEEQGAIVIGLACLCMHPNDVTETLKQKIPCYCIFEPQ